MKKVLALVLAVMMLATVAFAAEEDWGHSANNDYAKNRHVANITPGGSIEIDKNGLKDTGTQLKEIDDTDGTTGNFKKMTINVENEQGKNLLNGSGYSIDEGIFRSITNTNYTIQRVRVEKGSKNLVKGVSINDNEEKIVVDFIDDLDNQTSKSFEVSFTLKGKAKFILRDSDEVVAYNKYCATTKQLMKLNGKKVTTTPITATTDEGVDEYVGKRVTLPDIDFQFIGTVGYGRVDIRLGDTNDEEIEDLGAMGVDKAKDVVKFVNGGTAGTSKRIAGAYTADAILTEEYTDAMTLEARVYAGDVLYFNCKNSPDRDIVGRLADSDADMDFYLFNTNTKYTTLNSNAKLYFNDAEEDDFIYQIKDKKLVPVGTWSEDDDCWVVKTRVLGQYVVSDVELKEFEASAADIAADNNPDTGANDVVGIATALAAVALVSAAAVSLKK